MLTDTNFRPFARMSAERGVDAVALAQPVSWPDDGGEGGGGADDRAVSVVSVWGGEGGAGEYGGRGDGACGDE